MNKYYYGITENTDIYNKFSIADLMEIIESDGYEIAQFELEVEDDLYD